jgi:hypothetical protein
MVRTCRFFLFYSLSLFLARQMEKDDGIAGVKSRLKNAFVKVSGFARASTGSLVHRFFVNA